MSWQAYVDDQLISAGLCGGAIIGHDGSIWAHNSLSIKPGEGAAIVKLFQNPANVFSEGIPIGGVKYVGIKGDPRSIYGKKGAGGTCLVKTNQTVLIGIYDDKVQPGNAANIVEKLGDYLIDNGY